MTAEKKQVVIIGSGIGGSGIGALLAHRGHEVTVLEKLGFVGGRCCSREREGFIVDLGVHTFSQAGKGPLGEILRRCGKDDSRLIQWSYTRNPTQKLSYLGKMVEFPQQIDQVGADTQAYLSVIKTIVSMPAEEILALYETGLKDWLTRHTTDPVIHNIFAYIAELYFIVPYWRASAGEFIRSMQEQAKNRASGYPVGGCKVIPENYLKVVTDAGGLVRTGAEVKRINIEQGRATGVTLSSGETLPADIVISNADPQIMLRLAGEASFPPPYAARIRELEFTPGAYLLKFALSRKITEEKFIMHIGDADANSYLKTIEAGQVPEKVNLMMPVISNLDPTTAPEGRQLIIAGSFPAIEPDWDAWRRAVLASVKDIFPDIEEQALFIEDTSPETVDRLMGEGGAVIGMSQSLDQVGDKRLMQTTPVDDLYLVGAEAGGWGIGTELAAMSALELDELLSERGIS